MFDDDSPEFITQPGGRRVSFNALLEQIEAQFEAENAGRVDIFRAAQTVEARRALLIESANYVLANESIFLSRADKQRLIDAAYAGVFGFGPLAPYFDDESITQITIDGPDNVNARDGFGELARLPVWFEDTAHLRRTVERLLMVQGAQLIEWNFFVEIGVELHGRPVRLSIITPPVTPRLQVEMRLHPRQALTLDDLIARAMLTEAAAQRITERLAAGNGMLIVGPAGAGKTTLLGALLGALPGPVTLVQRAAELRPLPEASITEMNTFPPGDDDPGWTMNERVEAILSGPPPDWLVLDEVRDDAGPAAWAALNAPVQNVWVFRGHPQKPLRVVSALGMAVRRVPQAMGLDSAAINGLFAEQLPLVVSLSIRDGAPRVVGVGRFVLRTDGGLDLEPYTDVG
ncbi:MAG: Flp pilus assembly complex ATPase component TadA [Anaerolineae bacterium]|nr:Flp pilus assembly complex ATPase component TadA [Anaerolineae bacterium]